MTVHHVTRPTVIPVPGDKLIEEHVGRVATGTTSVSVAHMIAPAGWSEAPQQPQFDEVTMVVRGRLRVEAGDQTRTVAAGESILVPRGVRVCYANPFAEPCEYWAVCTPAFAVELAGR